MGHRVRQSVATTATITSSYEPTTPLQPQRAASHSRPHSTITTNTSANPGSLYARPAATGASWQLILIDVKKDFSNRGIKQRYCKLSIVIISLLLAGLVAALVLIWPRSVDVSIANNTVQARPALVQFTDTLPLTPATSVLYVNASIVVDVNNANLVAAELQDMVLSVTSKLTDNLVARSALTGISIAKAAHTTIQLPVNMRFESTSEGGQRDVMRMRDLCLSVNAQPMEFDVMLVGKWKPVIWPQRALLMRGSVVMPCMLKNMTNSVFDGLVAGNVTGSNS